MCCGVVRVGDVVLEIDFVFVFLLVVCCGVSLRAFRIAC